MWQKWCGNFLNDHGYDCYGLEVEDNKKVKDELKILDDDFFKKIFLHKA